MPLSSAAKDVLMQLFVTGPTWDGNITSKAGRGDLILAGLAFHENGWASLTPEGVRVAAGWELHELRQRQDKRWYQKART
jgi:hypothetical protein